jgi:hypothetical protein
VKLYIDENLPHALVAPLVKLFPKHNFRSFEQESLWGTEDIPLFRTLADREFMAIITQDARQLVNADERVALKSAGLHWIGVPQLNEPGIHGIASTMSMIITGLPFVFQHDYEEPHEYQLKQIAAQRLRAPDVSPL